MIERAFESAELDWRFLSFECGPNRLDEALRGAAALGFRGVKLAEAFRGAAAAMIEAIPGALLSDAARFSGSVGCLAERDGVLVGEDFEGQAVLRAALAHGPIDGRRAVLLGAGRAARSIGLALAQQGALLLVAEPDIEPAERLAEDLRGAVPNAQIEAGGYDEGDELALDPTTAVVVRPAEISEKTVSPAWIDFATLRPGMVVIDATLESVRTGLLRESAARGAVGVEGVTLLALETAMTLEAWTGVKVDPAVLADAAEEFLGL
ncbi:Shikimate dehydrogenase [Pirellulimonas nuda]|uniref:Shikimate dehydrogenase n=2 Tax=Pirellulimonas nuda TaxID=2528009 RepID=A0A518D633_9BACT|nr:Shikimate dehydrogenase [Pirellulimonas nuda]